MRLMMCIAVFFLSFTFLFRDNMNGYRMAANYKTFGRWIACSESNRLKSNSCLYENGYAKRGSLVYTLWPVKNEFVNNGIAKNLDVWNIKEEDRSNLRETFNQSRGDESHHTGAYIGAVSDGFAERNCIELINGRFPENDNEIAMELPLLDALGQGSEIGSEISFYVAKFDDFLLLKHLIKEYLADVRGEVNEDADDSIVYDYDVREIPGRNELYLVKYKLVGTIERYSTRWDTEMSGGEGGYMPGALITENEFNRLEMSKRTYRFFDLKPEYETEDVWHFAEDLMDDIDTSDEFATVSYALNRNAYNNPLWGNGEMYRSITILLTVISTCIIAYLMANYLGKRRGFFLRMREIGATTADVWKMAAYECVGSVLPVAAFTFAGAYLASVIVVYYIGRKTGVGFFYVFSLKTMLMILAEAGITVGLSLLAALAVFGGRSLNEKKKALSRSAVKYLKKRAAVKGKRSKRYLGLLETLKRDHVANRLKTRLLTIISILVCAIIIFCTVKTYEPAASYLELKRGAPDFAGETVTPIRSVDIRIPIKEFWDGHKMVRYIREGWNGEGLANKVSVNPVVADTMSSLAGVKSIDWCDRDFTHFITFDGKDEDSFFGAYLDTFLKNNQPLRGQHELNLSHKYAANFIKAMERDFYGIFCKRDADEYWNRYQKYLDPTVADYEAFLNGEQVIAVVDTDMIRAAQTRNYGTYYGSVKSKAGDVPPKGMDADGEWYGYKASFKPGDELTVLCREEGEVEVIVAGVVPLAEAGFGAEDERFLNVLGADAFMKRICDTDGVDWGYNHFEADLEVVSPKERVVTEFVNICANNRVRYENNIVKKFELREEMLRSIVTYGFFGLILAVMFFFVTAFIARDEEVRLSSKYRILDRFGMTVGRMKKEKRLDALFRTIPILLAFPVQIVIRFISEWDNSEESFLTRAISYSSPKIALTVIGIFAIVYWLIVSRMDTEWKKNGENRYE